MVDLEFLGVKPVDSAERRNTMRQKTADAKQLSDKPQRIYWLDVARVVAIISISLNHAVNRSYDNYTDQMAEFISSPMYSTL